MATKKGMIRKTVSARRAYEFPKRGAIMKDLEKKLAAARKRASNLAKKEKSNFFSGSGIKVQAAATITAGGAMAGAAEHYLPDGVFGFSAPLAVGTGLVATSMFLDDDMTAGILGAVGAGMLAAWASESTQNFLSKSA